VIFQVADPVKKREWKAKSKAIAAQQRSQARHQDRIRKEAGKTICEVCEEPRRLVTWDEREHRSTDLSPGRNPIWRICIQCRTRARSVKNEAGEK